MLKPPEPGQNGAGDERGVGEIVGQLVDEGKAYARAEFDLAKAIATAKASALKLPAILFGAALLFAQAAVTVLAVAVFAALQGFIGPILAGLVVLLIFGGLAGGLAWLGVKKLSENL